MNADNALARKGLADRMMSKGGFLAEMSTYFRVRSGIGGVLFLLGQLLMAGYALLSLYLYATNLGGGWFIASIIIFPLAFLYPFISVWQLGVFPASVAAIGAGALILGMVGLWLAEE